MASTVYIHALLHAATVNPSPPPPTPLPPVVDLIEKLLNYNTFGNADDE